MVIHKVKIPGNNSTTNHKNARTKLIDFGIELHRIDIEFNLPHSTLNLNQNANANVTTHAYTSNRQMTPVKKYLRIKSLDASGAIGMHLLHDDHNVNVNVNVSANMNMNMNDNDTGTNRMGMILASNNYELIGINNESCRNLSRKRIEAILVKEGGGAGAGDVILLIKEHGNMGMDNNTYRKGRGYGNNKKNKPLATDCCRCSQSGDCKCLCSFGS